MQIKKFIKKIENFICENCGIEIIGNGYTNHCDVCLFSKHVDLNPGDRLGLCGGLMTPAEIIQEGQNFSILHKCQKCGILKKNKISEKDSFEKVLEISKNKNK
jgi:rubrerythrin